LLRHQHIVFIAVFSAALWLSCGQKIHQEKKSQPLLQMQPLPTGVGVNIHFYQGNDKDLAMLKEAQVGIVRMDVSWGEAEKTPGQYDFVHYDRLIADLDKLGIRLLFILDYGNRNYEGGLAPHTDAGRTAFARFASALADRYRGKNIIWELWNEPNLDHFWMPKTSVDDYMAWCKAVVPAMRKVDPNICIVAPALSGFDMPFFDACFQQGLLTLVDGIAVHPYRNPERGPETAMDDYCQLALLIEQFKPADKPLPILSGEWGYSSTRIPRELQGKYIARQWLCNLVCDVPISIWYDWHDDGQDPAEGEHNFGTVTYDYLPKPAYLAMSTLIHSLHGFSVIGRIGFGEPDDYVLLFGNGESVRIVAWTAGRPHSIDLGDDLQIAEAVDHLGQVVSIAKGSAIWLDDGPRYLTPAQPLSGWLRLIVRTHSAPEGQALKAATALIENQPSQSELGNELMRGIASSNEMERQAAFFSLCLLADKFVSDSASALELYHLILKKGAGLAEMQKAIFMISKIRSTQSMDLVAPYFHDRSLAQAVADYYLQMAPVFAEEGNFAKSEEMLLMAAGVAQNKFLVARVLEKIEAQDSSRHIDPRLFACKIGFINWWKIAGPFPNQDGQGAKTAFFPEAKIDFSQKQRYDSLVAKWQTIRADDLFGIIPFAELFGKKRLIAYAYAELRLPKASSMFFKIGSNDGVVCWLNGVKVHENYASRSLTVDEDVVSVNVRRGINRILIKIANEGLNWEACLRVCDADGRAFDLSSYWAE